MRRLLWNQPKQFASLPCRARATKPLKLPSISERTNVGRERGNNKSQVNMTETCCVPSTQNAGAINRGDKHAKTMVVTALRMKSWNRWFIAVEDSAKSPAIDYVNRFLHHSSPKFTIVFTEFGFNIHSEAWVGPLEGGSCGEEELWQRYSD